MARANDLGPRRFSGRKKAALYLLAGGRCEACGTELEVGWHADHIHPYSRGGPTEMGNGQALCPSCNRKKGARVKRKPRDWQQKAFEKWGRQETFMLAACPGAGKTQFALMCSEDLKGSGLVDRTIFVVPNRSLVDQVCEAAHELLGAKFVRYNSRGGRPARDTDGLVLTYQQVAQIPEVYEDLAPGQLVVFDESHHMADEGDWGRACKQAFGSAAYKLLTTGTPWRTDGQRIPFVSFGDDGFLETDYEYLFPEAWADPQCPIRSIEVNTIDADGSWTFKGSSTVNSVRGSLIEPSSREEGKWLSACYKWSGDWIEHAFSDAHSALLVAKQSLPAAQGLWIAASKEHADAYGEFLALKGIGHRVIHNEVEAAHRALASFPKSGEDWIIAVDMVSEGVDNSNLAVLLYATNKTTEMYFLQSCGRVIRKTSHEDPITAKVFVPDSPTFRAHIEQLDHQKSYELRKPLEMSVVSEREIDRLGSELLIYPSENALTTATTLKGLTDPQAAKEALVDLLSSRNLDTNQVAAVQRFINEIAPEPETQDPVPIDKAMSPADRGALRTKRQRLIVLIAKAWGLEYREVNNHLNKLFGKRNNPWEKSPYESVEQRSDDDLQLEIRVLSGWLETGLRPYSLHVVAA